MDESNKLNKAVDESICVADNEHMLHKAEQHIQKLTCELKEKEYAMTKDSGTGGKVHVYDIEKAEFL